MTEGVLLSVQEVARRLAVDDSTIRRWLYRGTFSNAFKADKVWRIPQADLDAFVEKQRRERRIATSTSES